MPVRPKPAIKRATSGDASSMPRIGPVHKFYMNILPKSCHLNPGHLIPNVNQQVSTLVSRSKCSWSSMSSVLEPWLWREFWSSTGTIGQVEVTKRNSPYLAMTFQHIHIIFKIKSIFSQSYIIISYHFISVEFHPYKSDCLAELLASESFFKSVSNASKRPVSFSLVALSFSWWSNDTWKSFKMITWNDELSLHPHCFTGPSFFH